MTKLDKDQVIEKFTQAFNKANGKAPEIDEAGGWYSVDGGKKVRLATLDEMADELAGGKTGSPAKAEKAAAKPKAKAQDKKVADKKSASKKTTPKKSKAKAKSKSKKSDTGFSVKAFWAEQIEDKNPGSKLPR